MTDTSSGIPLMYIQQYSTGGTGFSYVGFKFLHTYFAILFCQNKVKKNCKFTTRVFLKNAYITHEERLGRMYTYMRIYLGNVNLLLHEQNRCHCSYYSALSGI